MDTPIKHFKNHYLLLGVGAAILLFVLVLLPLFSSKQKLDQPVQIGQTAVPTIYNNRTKTTDGTQYSTSSSLITRSSIVTTDASNKVVYKRTVFLAPQTKLPQQSTYSTLGAPEKVLTGSSYYGETITTSIYASKGVTLISNPDTGEVYEMQEYVSTTVDGYISQYGQDLNPNAKSPEAL